MIKNQTQGVLARKDVKVGNGISITYSINYGSNEILSSGLKKNAPIIKMGTNQQLNK